jgi:DNA primase
VPANEDYLLGWLLRYPTTPMAVQEKLRRDLAAFPLVKEFMEETPLELLEKIDNRAIWKAWITQPDGLDPQQWVQTLDETLHDQAQHVLQLNVPEPQSYRYVSDVLECATILQRHRAQQWKDRIKQQVNDATDEQERSLFLERLVQIKEYIDSISIPKRSTTYPDLHRFRTV